MDNQLRTSTLIEFANRRQEEMTQSFLQTLGRSLLSGAALGTVCLKMGELELGQLLTHAARESAGKPSLSARIYLSPCYSTPCHKALVAANQCRRGLNPFGDLLRTRIRSRSIWKIIAQGI